MTAYINAIGSYLPERVVTNEELATLLQIEPAQIFKSSGIRERRWANEGETTSSLAAKALEASGAARDEIDYLILGTMTPDRFIPGSASAVQSQLSLPEIPCLDIRAACCNTLYGLQLARALITSGVSRKLALCLAEVQSRFIDLSPAAATTSMLFGDGAASLLITSEPGEGALEIVDVYLATDGKYVDDLGIRSPGSEFGRDSEAQDYRPRMVGQSVILQASRRMVSACQTVLKRNELEIDQVSFVVPHQANANLLAQVARGLGMKDQTKVISVIETTGNTSSASMGVALDRLMHAGKLKENDYVLMPAFGAGFTWGAALCKKSSASLR
jgi:3-oxoacyl-[acyl-carrier-protein] synthase-3